MLAYLLETGREIEPFGPLASLRLHNQAAPELQERTLRAAGCGVERIESVRQVRVTPSLLVHDDLYFTAGAVRRFVKLARKQPGQHRAALQRTLLTETIAPALQGELAPSGDRRRYDLYYLRSAPSGGSLQDECSDLVVPAPFGKVGAPTHKVFCETGRYISPISTVFLCPLRHWSNLVACQLLGMAAAFQATAARQWLSIAALPLAAAWRSGSLRPRSVLDKTYLRGRRCRVHPTAVVEGAILGDRVRIGPHAVVRFCIIGDRAVVGPRASLDGCTIGRRALITAGVTARASTFGDESSISTQFNQLSIVGDRAVLCPNAGLLDFSMRGSVPVELEGERRPSGSSILGGAVGHDAFVGPNIEVACGTSLPNGCTLIRNPRSQVRSVDRESLPDDIWRLDRGRRRRAA